MNTTTIVRGFLTLAMAFAPAAYAETIALTAVTSPITAGAMSLWSNGERRTWGPPQTLGDGTQLFPRLTEGGASSSGTINVPNIAYFSLDSEGLRQHKSESTVSTTTYSPPRILLPWTLTIGQTVQQLYTRTTVTASTGASTTSGAKEITTFVGFEPLVTPLGTYPALKVMKQTLTALPDGSFPDPSTAAPQYTWYGSNGAGILKSVTVNAITGNPLFSQSLLEVGSVSGTPPAPAAAPSGTTIALTDVTGPIVAGAVSLWTNGESRIWGAPQTLGDGTQLFPRLNEGGAGPSGFFNIPSVGYYSLDSNGLRQHKAEITLSITTYSPPRIFLPPTMTIGQTVEQLFTRTTVSSVTGVSTTSNAKEITIFVGFEPVFTPLGTYQALKVTKLFLTALSDGSFPDPSTVPPQHSWYGSNGAGILKIASANLDGSISSSQTLFGVDRVSGTPPAPGAAPSGTTIALTDVTRPITAGAGSLWTNGESRTWGTPQTLADGTQLFPRLNAGGANTAGTINVPNLGYYSLDGNGLRQHKSESTISTTTYSPPRIFLPPTMTIGQTVEQLYTRTTVTASNGVTTASSAKELTTFVGFEPVITPLGTYQALKVMKQTLTALPDGSFPDPSTAAPQYTWYGSNGAGILKIVNANLDGTTSLMQTLLGVDALANAATPSANPAFTPALVPGFNLLGNSVNTPINVMSIFGNQTSPVSGITDNIASVWKWDAINSKWQFHSPLLTTAANANYASSHNFDVLTSVAAGEGYWVNALTALNLPPQTGAAFNWNSFNFASLQSGFNLIAHGSYVTPSQFNANVRLTPPEPGVVSTDIFSTLWAWDAINVTWFFYSPLLESSNGLAGVKGYADSHFFQHFQDFNKKIDVGVGFWVNKF